MSFKNGCIFLALSCLSLNSLAQDHLIVSNCMFQKLKDHSKLLEQSKQFSVIETTLDDSVLNILHQNQDTCGKFINLEPYRHTKLSQQQLLSKLTRKNEISSQKTFSITHAPQVKQLYQLINSDMILQTSLHLTSYMNRSAKKDTGVQAAHWFKEHFDTMAKEYNRNDVNSYFVNTGKKYIQPSVVTVIGKDKPGEAVVIGAHIDTLSGNMPGADDDASGIAVAVEIARVLLASDIKLDSPVYIIAYAAEEQGLVGSGYVVQSFLEKKIPIKAVMQLDQAGYRANPKDDTIWLMKDYVDNKLTQFTAQLLTQYVQVPVAYSQCGYACSDHANWSQNGFRACYPSATTLDDDNPYIHSAEDKLEIINLDHMVNFTKLGLAFVAELGIQNPV